MVFITYDYFLSFDQITKTIIRIIKNNAVPTYAKKLSSGLGKKSRTRAPKGIIPKIIFVSTLIISLKYSSF